MNFHALFLRGVNVGGVKILMKDLAALLGDAGSDPVKTLLASGNVVVGSPEPDPLRVKDSVAQALRERYGRDIGVLVQDEDQLASIMAGYPFESPGDGIARHRYLVFTPSDRDAGGILAGAPAPADSERVAQLGPCICWEVPRGDSLGSPLAKHFAKAATSTLVTTRNMNTIGKVLVALRALAR